jgi:hypothetical protein
MGRMATQICQEKEKEFKKNNRIECEFNKTQIDILIFRDMGSREYIWAVNILIHPWLEKKREKEEDPSLVKSYCKSCFSVERDNLFTVRNKKIKKQFQKKKVSKVSLHITRPISLILLIF